MELPKNYILQNVEEGVDLLQLIFAHHKAAIYLLMKMTVRCFCLYQISTFVTYSVFRLRPELTG